MIDTIANTVTKSEAKTLCDKLVYVWAEALSYTSPDSMKNCERRCI